MNKILPLILAILVAVPFAAYAEDFTIAVQEQEEYLAGKIYTLPLTITNSGPEEWFSISILGVPSDWMSVSSQSLKVNQSSSGTTNIIFAIPKTAKPSFYTYLLSVKRTSTGEVQQKQLLTWVRQISSVIVSDLKLSCTDCLERLDISGTVDNVGTRDQFINLKLTLNGKEKVHEIGTLNATDSKSFEDTFLLDGMQPGDYVVGVELRNDTGYIVFSDEAPFTIESLKNISYQRKISSNVFGIFATLTATNSGNGNDMANFNSEVLKQWYAFYNGPEPNSISGNIYNWSVELKSGESAKISYSEVYWPVILIIIVLIGAGLYMYVQLVTLSIRKHVKNQKVEKGKDISVSLHIKSMMRAADSVFVKDHIPLGFSITEKFETIKPLIRKKDDGTELIWKVGGIGKNEYRIINYKIKPTREVIGKVQLPPAKIRAKYNGRPAIEKSNPIFLYGEQKESKTVSVRVE